MGKSEKKDKKKKEEVVKDVADAQDVEMATVDASPKKSKKEKKEEKGDLPIILEELSPIAKPLAQKKLLKKLHKVVKKGSKARQVKRGVKEVVKGIRKGEKGLLVLAADINPIDIISHLPVLSEEANIPYVFVPSKEELGHASSTKRPTSCVMICPNLKRKSKPKDGAIDEKDEEYLELYKECYKEVEKLDTKLAFYDATLTVLFTRSFPKFGNSFAVPNVNTYFHPLHPPPTHSFKKSMPAPKTKSSAPSFKGKAPAENGLSAPASAGEKKDTLEVVLLAGGKPDKAAHEKEQDRIQKEIDALQVKLSAVREKINLASQPSAGNERRNALKSELDSLREQQSSKKYNRGQLLEQVKSLQDSLQKKIKELQAQKSKVPFKTVGEIDDRVAALEKQIESGSMKLADEKRALQEISQIRRTRRIVENFQPDQDAIDSYRQEIDEIKKQLDDPEAKALSDRFEAIKVEFDELKKETDEAYAGRNKLFEERDSVNNQIKALLQEKRERHQAYREAHDKHWAKVSEDRARRAEKYRVQRAEEEARKKLEIAQRIRDEASTPAFQSDIEDCQTLIDFFSGKSTATVAQKSANSPFTRAEVAGVPKLELRQVEAVPEGAVVRKKKGEDEDNYFVAGGKGKKGKKGGASKVVNGLAEDNSAAPSPASEKLHIPLGNLSALLALSIPAPDSQADVPRVIEDLKTKKTWFEANQARVTQENLEKAEAEIARLTKQEPKASAAVTPSGAETPISEVAPSSAVESEKPAEEDAVVLVDAEAKEGEVVA
ncbi:hypothetical protein D9756_000619 [Leucocoprinus leucothites]|uniref:Ribosomal protein eL8/eL30/eS12/Gadd45 domain-containing protein n=1 Tax=Leucocoprinus leucothites TaxID=201217 RepID=A0A8H5LP31_9AGAR|nr:hypothetical protein D9756_000619 [Leucoagaricus leucothites]